MPDVKVTISEVDGWARHRFERGKPNLSDIEHVIRTRNFYIVLPQNKRDEIANASLSRGQEIKNVIKADIEELSEFVEWLKDD